MNANTFRLVFSKRLGMLVPVAEVQSAHRKTAGQPGTGAATATAPPASPVNEWPLQPVLRAVMAAMCAASGSLWMSGVVMAQTTPLPTGGQVVQGAGTSMPRRLLKTSR